MTQSELNRSIARMTGEDVRTIERRGFSLLDHEQPASEDDLPLIDWDALAARRQVGLVPNRRRAS